MIIFIKVVVIIMLFMVVAVVVALIVGFSVLASTTTLVMAPGTLAQPYHLNYYCDYFYQSGGTHYTIRGGGSNGDSRCGVFCVSDSSFAVYTSWSAGAALSFKPISNYIL